MSVFIYHMGISFLFLLVLLTGFSFFNKVYLKSSLIFNLYEDLGLLFKFISIVSVFILIFVTLNYLSFYYLSLGMTMKYGVVTTYSLMTLVSLWVIWLSEQWHGVFGHFLPLGVQGVLQIFIPLIEILGVVIRPLTLAIRLATNISCGHVVLLMFSYFSLSLNPYLVSMVSFLLIFLFLIELLVCLIQAYVFWSLIYIYSMDISLDS